MVTKICKKCGEEKPIVDYWKCKDCKDGHRNSCIECEKKRKRQYYRENKEEICRKTEEYRQKNIERDKEIKREYYLKNKDEFIERVRKWESENKEKKRLRNKRYRIEKPHLARERQRRYIENNKERYKLMSRRYSSIRRSREKALKNDFTEEQWLNCLKHFDNKCAYCGSKPKVLEQEHVIPVSKGGGYTKTNIVPSCKSCNTSKLDRDFITWYRNQDYYSEEREMKINTYLGRALDGKGEFTKAQLETIKGLE